MYYPENSSRKKKGNKSYLWVGAAAIILVAAIIPSYIYGPALYYQFTGDAVLRIQKKAAHYESFLASGKTDQDLPGLIADSRKMLDVLERSQPVRWELPYYRGLFDFFEYIVRLQCDGRSLIRLVGRGFLPQEIDPAVQPPTQNLARSSAIHMRRALAYQPDMSAAPTARLVIAYSDLMSTGRTDLYLRDLMEAVRTGELPAAYRAHYEWMALAIGAMLGQIAMMESMAQEIQKAPPDSGHIKLTPDQLSIVLAFGSFYAKDYIRALQYARTVKYNLQAPVDLRVEATRLEGEIFLVQSGPLQARFFFEEALKLSGGSDTFVSDRIQSLERPAR